MNDYENKLIEILNEELVVAEGCTEPIAIAYTAAKATDILGTTPERLDVYVSGNIIKNVKSVVIPNSGGEVGIEASAALGAIGGDCCKELLVISDLCDKHKKEAKAFVEAGKVNVIHEDTDIKLYVKIVAFSGGDCAVVEIKHIHTNITKIIKNDALLLNQICNDADFNSSLSDRSILTVEKIYNAAKSIDIAKIKPLFNRLIELNSNIANVGLTENYGVNIGKYIRDNIKTGFYGDDIRNNAASFAAAGSDARMSGCPLPVMTTSGSGNQGMTASLAIIETARILKKFPEDLIRALFLSHLVTIHIKTNVGRLSAYCGVVCAGAAVSGALAFLYGENYEIVAHSIINTIGNISGIICDGAKASCALKIASSIYAGFDGYVLAKNGKYLCGGDGIVSDCVEKTLKNIAKLSQEGMNETDKVIIDIMM